ncbi:methionine ABC transporter substrate-binding protein [Marinococcus halophilus]|uniref:Lipoprotein n=1 Tax=Marinococcus halophilus TaxID=1371 RepID=A0A510YAT8_MARHA|nr:MetQ/NlpA family ABC transporter substrate-binding protein [Marinococcus halophilus]OZT79407.1 methionine ABC transporter substrate-binding protein [Marinococcus halophilus]GEK59487.1 lipoprotein [Marinococcus halophilus]
MKKTLLGVSLLSTAVLAACGSDSESGDGSGEDTQTLTVGATSVPHAEILEFAEDQLEEENIELEIETFNDYIVPNEALASEEIDANYFQHIPYLEDQMEENENYDFVNMGGIHIEPIGVYSQEYDSLDALPDGAEIIMSNSVADHGRILQMLEQEGMLTLEEGAGVEATVEDIAENPKNLQFQADIDAATLPQVYNNGEGDAVFINSNYAIDADLNPQEDAIALESPEDNPYVNVVAARAEDEDNETIQTLVEVLQSEETQQFIEEEYDGAVIPAEQ